MLELTLEQIGTLYPYFILLSANGEVQSVGPDLERYLPRTALGARLTDYFTVIHPNHSGFRIEQIETPLTVSLTAQSVPLPLRGTVLALKPGGQFLFLGALWVREIDELAKGKLTLNAIPQHDSTLDYLLALQAYRTAFAESRSLAEKLTAEKKQLRQTNQQLEKSEEKYRGVVENIKEVIFQTDEAGHWTFLNRAWEEITGFPILDTLGHRFSAFVIPEQRAGWNSVLQTLASGEQSEWRQEIAFLTREGGLRWMEVVARLTRNDHQKSLALSGTLFDITDRKDAETRLQALTVELQRSNRELSDFATVASHDLQEPLRKILMFSQQLRSTLGDQLPPESQRPLDRMCCAAVRMQELIHGLLDYARITTRAKPFAEVCLSDLLTEVLSDLEEAIIRTQATIISEPLPTIQGDALQIRQLLQNLIGNGLKFQKPASRPEIRVTFRSSLTEEGREMAAIRISDNGIGIEPQYCERIFEVFERLHPATEYPGTGMGLAICRKIVERHRGAISLTSTFGAGSEFTVHLPLVQIS